MSSDDPLLYNLLQMLLISAMPEEEWWMFALTKMCESRNHYRDHLVEVMMRSPPEPFVVQKKEHQP